MTSRLWQLLSNRRYRALVVSMMLLASLVIAVPVLAYTGSQNGYYNGANCGWDGAQEHWDETNPAWDRAVGVTGFSYGYPSPCTQSRLKVRWKSHNGTTYTSYYWGGAGVNSGVIWNAKYLYWTDHDVYLPFTWSGFRMYH